jgi:hypothetical protein
MLRQYVEGGRLPVWNWRQRDRHDDRLSRGAGHRRRDREGVDGIDVELAFEAMDPQRQ